MGGFDLAYVALVSVDVPAAAAVLSRLGLRQQALPGHPSVPVFPAGASALALFRPDDPALGGAARTGVHHIALAAADPTGTAARLGIPHQALPGGRVLLDTGATAGVRTMLAPPLGLGAGGSDHVLRLDHIGIASADNQAGIAAFRDRLGCPLESQQTDLETQIAVESFTSDKYGVVQHARPPAIQGGLRVAFLTTGDCELEFLQNFDPRQPGTVDHGSTGTTRQDQGAIARYVARHGPGLHHVAFRCPDIDRTLAMLAASGVAVIDRIGRPGSRRARIGFLHPQALGGILLHAVEREDIAC